MAQLALNYLAKHVPDGTSVDELVLSLAEQWSNDILNLNKAGDEDTLHARMDDYRDRKRKDNSTPRPSMEITPETIVISGPSGYDSTITLVKVEYRRNAGFFRTCGLPLLLNSALAFDESDLADKSEERCKEHYQIVCSTLEKAAELASKQGPHKVVFERLDFDYKIYQKPDETYERIVMARKGDIEGIKQRGVHVSEHDYGPPFE